MKENKEKFLLSEYGNSRIQPYSYSFGQYDIIVPKEYASPMETFDSLEKALFDKYLGENAIKEREKYAKIGMKAPRLRTGDLFLIKPFRMRDLSDEEALKKVTAEAFRRYKKAVSLAIKLRNAEPDREHPVKVGTADVKSMNTAYNKILLKKFGNNTCVAAAKISNAAQKQGRFLRGTFAQLSAPLLKAMARKYNRQLSQLQKFYKEHRTAVKATGGIALGALLAAGTAHKNNSEKDFFTPNFELLSRMQEPIDTMPESMESLQTGSVERLNPNVVEYLKENGLDKLNDVQKHNLDMYLQTRNAGNLFIAFAENFHEEAYDDGKGFMTIGYGCTSYLDEKGRPWKKSVQHGKRTALVVKGQRTTMTEAMEQVNRYSDFVILPKILNNVKVKLNDNQMIATKNFAYVSGNGFQDSKYLEALNKNKSNTYLGKCLTLWCKDAGVPKRLFFCYLVLIDRLQAKDIAELKPGGCYAVELDDVLVCYKNPDGSTKMTKEKVVTTERRRNRRTGKYASVKVKHIRLRPMKKKDREGMAFFISNSEDINKCIALASPTGDEKKVADIVPKSTLQNLETVYMAMGDPATKTVYMLPPLVRSRN